MGDSIVAVGMIAEKFPHLEQTDPGAACEQVTWSGRRAMPNREVHMAEPDVQSEWKEILEGGAPVDNVRTVKGGLRRRGAWEKTMLATVMREAPVPEPNARSRPNNKPMVVNQNGSGELSMVNSSYWADAGIGAE